MTPFFSIVVPVYNTAPYLRESLDSVLTQSVSDWECICVDDGSTDESGAILDEYASKDDRFNVIHQANQGVSAARNVGMDMATGNWLTFLDADDLYAPKWLETAKRLIEDTNPDLLRMNRTMFRDKPPARIDERFECNLLDNTKEIQDWGWMTFIDNGFSWEQFQRRKDAVHHRFPVGVTLSEDEIRSLGLLKNVRRICVSDYAGYFYRGRSDSAVSQRLSADERLRYLEEYSRLVPDEQHLPVYAQQLWECVTGWIRRHVRGDWKNSARIRRKFIDIVAAMGIKSRHMRLQWRVPFVLYRRFGIVSPIFFTRWLLNSLVSFGMRPRDRNR